MIKNKICLLEFFIHKKNYITWFVLALVATFLPLLSAWYGYVWPLSYGFCSYTAENLASAIGGAVPYSDASGYILGGHYFSQMGVLDGWSMRRPLNALFFSLRLRLADYNFWYTMMLQSIVCAVPLSFYMQTLRRDLGLLSAFWASLFIFHHLMIFAHSTLSEMLGLTLGILSFILLWNGWMERKSSIYNAGIVVLTIALSTRAGPQMMILATLLLVYLRPFTSSWKGDLFKSSLCFVVTFFLMSKLPLWFGEAGQNAALSNFSYTIYGLVKGGKIWSYYLQDAHIMKLIEGTTEFETARILYQESWIAFKENPLLLFKGCAIYFGSFCASFVKFFMCGQGLIKALSVAFGVVFWSYLAVRLYINRHILTDVRLFLFVFFMAIAASACIVFKDGGIRVFMVAIPFMAALIGLAFAKIQPMVGRVGSMASIALCVFIVGGSVGQRCVFPNHQAPQGNTSDPDVIVTHNPSKSPYFVTTGSESLQLHHINIEKFASMTHVYNEFGPDLLAAIRHHKECVVCWVYDYARHCGCYCVGTKSILDLNADWVSMKVNKNKDIYEIVEIKEIA